MHCTVRESSGGSSDKSSKSPPARPVGVVGPRRPASQRSDSDDANRAGSYGSEDDDLGDQDGLVRSGKRKRPISVSCELCKQRKVKCDRGQPSCGWCSRNGAICEYKERKKPGLRAGYGRELEQRLDKLEEILRSHSEILHASYTNSSSSNGNHNSSNGNHNINGNHSSSNGNHNNSNGHQNGNRGDHNSSNGNMRTSLPSEGTPRDISSIFRAAESLRSPQESGIFLPKPVPFNSTPTIDNRLPEILQPDYYASQPNIHSPTLAITQAPRPPSPDQDMPPYDLLYALVDLYFKHINTWCPILHRKTTLDTLFGPSALEETDRVLLHAIVATTMRYSTDVRLTEERRKHYHQVSKQRVLLYGMENSSVKALQALVILALDLVGDSNGPPGWNIMALITRSVVQLGLSVETTSVSVAPQYASIYTLRATVLPEPRDFIEDEARRRLFWMVYLLDRYATISTAFEFALDDREVDRTLPCRDDLWIQNQKVETRWFKTGDEERGADQPENLGALAYYIEILGILSKIHQFLKQPVDISALGDVEKWQMRYRELDTMLTSWKFNLPSEFGNMSKLFTPGSKSVNCAWVMLHATYHTAVVRLHSSAAYPTTRSPIFTPSYSAAQRCQAAVENIAALAEFVVKNGLLPKLGPPFAFTLWVAARLLLVHGSTIERKLSPQITLFVDALREMGRYWPVAARYCSLLQRVLDEHRESERVGNGVTPSSVKILADMRRTAFDLDLLISRQPRQTPAPNELEYLDVFDFFNMPRLPETEGASEFNITNFMVDADSDWLFKQEGTQKFITA